MLASLPLKLQPVTFPPTSDITIAAPSFLAKLSVKLQFSIIVSGVLEKIPPPLAAELLIKFELLTINLVPIE